MTGAACSSVEGVTLRVQSPANDEARAIVISVAQELGFSQPLSYCNTISGEWCAGRPSPYESWPLVISTDAREGWLRVSIGRRNVGLTKDEKAIIVAAIRELEERGIHFSIERALGVRLPKDLQAPTDREAA